MLSRYFYEGCEDEQLFAELQATPTFNLVREVNFTYGLKILRQTSIHDAHSHSSDNRAYQMVYSDGIAVCKLYSHKRIDEKGDEYLEYCYRSPFSRKQRGSSDSDKEIYRSVKISTLMTTLKRQKVVPDVATLRVRKAKQVDNALDLMHRRLEGNKYKHCSLSVDEIHGLLAAFLGESTSIDIDRSKCKIELDKFNEIDTLKQQAFQAVERMFCKPYYQIGIDAFGHLLVGKLVGESISVELGDLKLKFAEDSNSIRFKRYINPSDCAELVPLMTMAKVAYEDKHSMAGFIPITDTYDENLDAVFCYNHRPTHYDQVWMFTPAGEA